MTVLCIAASPRMNGNSRRLLDGVITGLGDEGVETRIERTHDMNIEPCTGCGVCERTGRCVIDDDFTGLRDAIIGCRGVIFATPLYFMNVPSRGKAFIDRCQVFWTARHHRHENLFGGKRRYGLLVASAGAKKGPGGSDLFRGLRDTMTYTFDALGIDDFGELLAGGLDRGQGNGLRDDAITDARDKGRAFARRLKTASGG